MIASIVSRRRRRLVAPLAALSLLAGCAGLVPAPPAEDPRPAGLPAALPLPAGTQPDDTLAIDRWWLAFDDAALHRTIERALAHNADLALAAARLREARARFDEARGARQPTLALQAQSGRARASAESIAAPAPALGSSHELALVGQVEIDLWGRLAAASDAARAQLVAQAWARAALQWSLTAQVAEAHFRLRALQRQAEIAESVRASRERTAALRQSEQRAGAASEFERRRADAELAAAAATLAGLQRQRLALEAALALLAGEPVQSFATAPAPPAALDTAMPFEPRLPRGDVAGLLQRRPDLRQAEAELVAARADVAAARAASWPSLQLSGRIGSDVRELSSLFSGPGFAWSLAAGLSQSLFDGGRTRARVEQAEARGDAALLSYRQRVAAALAETREAYAALELQQQAWQAERQRVAALERAYRLALTGQRVGALSQIDALDAERQHFSAQLAEVDALRERLLGQVAVFKALGGGHGGAEPSDPSPGASR